MPRQPNQISSNLGDRGQTPHIDPRTSQIHSSNAEPLSNHSLKGALFGFTILHGTHQPKGTWRAKQLGPVRYQWPASTCNPQLSLPAVSPRHSEVTKMRCQPSDLSMMRQMYLQEAPLQLLTHLSNRNCNRGGRCAQSVHTPKIDSSVRVIWVGDAR